MLHRLYHYSQRKKQNHLAIGLVRSVVRRRPHVYEGYGKDSFGYYLEVHCRAHPNPIGQVGIHYTTNDWHTVHQGVGVLYKDLPNDQVWVFVFFLTERDLSTKPLQSKRPLIFAVYVKDTNCNIVWDNNGGYNYTLCSFAYRHPKKPQYGWKWSAPNVLFF